VGVSDDPVQMDGNEPGGGSGARETTPEGVASAAGSTTAADGPVKGGFKHIRLVIALVVASLLGTFAVYTAIADTSIPVVGVAAASTDHDGEKIRLEGRVIASEGDAATPGGMRFTLRDFETSETVQVVYRGSVPDAYRIDREVIVDGTMQNGVLQAEPDTLVAKCPSKYQEEASTDAASD
jgi:cytochrome c-type biogenesis protein CcmE